MLFCLRGLGGHRSFSIFGKFRSFIVFSVVLFSVVSVVGVVVDCFGVTIILGVIFGILFLCLCIPSILPLILLI